MRSADQEKSSRLKQVRPNWQHLANVHAFTTTRQGGASEAPYASMNLGLHVGDLSEVVEANRRNLVDAFGLPGEPQWLDQVHGNAVITVEQVTAQTPAADALVTRRAGVVLSIMSADCLPVVLVAPEYGVVAVAHGGWRGLADGIVARTLQRMDCPPEAVTAWLGPAIGADHFEVGDEVWDRFVAPDWHMASCFAATPRHTFMADLYAIARRQLSTLGVQAVSGGEYCTWRDTELFYSYRRAQSAGLEGRTGRMATLVWFDAAT